MMDRIRNEFNRLHFADIALTVLAIVPYALGWLVGIVVRLTLWLVAAVIAGYHAGRGEE
jgi:hypothetical protein